MFSSPLTNLGKCWSVLRELDNFEFGNLYCVLLNYLCWFNFFWGIHKMFKKKIPKCC